MSQRAKALAERLEQGAAALVAFAGKLTAELDRARAALGR
jgi:hypothetical protein